jgi:hypothetical protein
MRREGTLTKLILIAVCSSESKQLSDDTQHEILFIYFIVYIFELLENDL